MHSLIIHKILSFWRALCAALCFACCLLPHTFPIAVMRAEVTVTTTLYWKCCSTSCGISEYRGSGNLSFSQYSLSIVTAVLGGDIAFVGDITFGWVEITVLGGDVVVFVGGITFGGLSPDLVLKGVLVLFVDPIEVLELVAIMVSVCIMEHRLYLLTKLIWGCLAVHYTNIQTIQPFSFKLTYTDLHNLTDCFILWAF